MTHRQESKVFGSFGCYAPGCVASTTTLRLMRSTFVFVIALLVGGSPSARAEDLVLDTLGAYLEALRVQAGIPGLAAAIVGANGIVWERAFGYQDQELAIPITPDTAFHLDGVTQVVVASLVLRCVEDGRLRLDDAIGHFDPDSPDADATLREILTHTTASAEGRMFDYRPERLDSLRLPVEACTAVSFHEAIASWLDALGMADSVPGPDAVAQMPYPDAAVELRYQNVLSRLTIPYLVDERRRAVPSQYNVFTLTPAAGLVSTVRDYARFDLALRVGLLLSPQTRTLTWSAPIGRDGNLLPHAHGWFVGTHADGPVIWQYGVGADASSSLVVTALTQGLTLVLFANSDELASPFLESVADVRSSPFARLFLDLVAP